MIKETQNRFRGLRSWYDAQTDTHFVYVYEKATNKVKASLKITGNKIQILSGEFIQ